MIHTTTDADFETDVLKADKPVLVDFWAEWCNPCKAQLPALQDLAASHESDLRVVKVDMDSNLERAQQFGVRSIPTMLLFRDGQVVKTLTGLQSRAALEALVAA